MGRRLFPTHGTLPSMAHGGVWLPPGAVVPLSRDRARGLPSPRSRPQAFQRAKPISGGSLLGCSFAVNRLWDRRWVRAAKAFGGPGEAGRACCFGSGAGSTTSPGHLGMHPLPPVLARTGGGAPVLARTAPARFGGGCGGHRSSKIRGGEWRSPMCLDPTLYHATCALRPRRRAPDLVYRNGFFDEIISCLNHVHRLAAAMGVALRSP